MVTLIIGAFVGSLILVTGAIVVALTGTTAAVLSLREN